MNQARHRWTWVLLALCALVLAGCGDTKTVTVVHTTTVSTPNATASAPSECHTMNCVLATQPPPNTNTLPGAFPTVWGLDFAYGSVSAAGARAQGARFGASYLSVDAGKNWTGSLIRDYHAAGLATVAVWETVATRSAEGCAAGASDARAAAKQLHDLGAPAGQPFTMAIDFDATGAQVAEYFRCASGAEPGRVNAYGGYYPLLYLSQHHLVGHLNWQTYAWSGGHWLPASVAPLEQYLNGSVFDHDRALAANYGQWPYKATPVVRRLRHHYSRYPTTHRRLCNCRERATARLYDKLRAEQRAKHHPHQRELAKLRHDAHLLANRILFLAEGQNLGDSAGPTHWGIAHRRYRHRELTIRAHGGVADAHKHHHKHHRR